MKIRAQTVTVAIALAIASCLLTAGMRSFAQTGPHDINLPDWQKLKAPYDKDGRRYENEVLKKHAKAYCVRHKKAANDSPTNHCPKSQTSASPSSIISVGNSSSSSPGLMALQMGANVTQQISCLTDADKRAILDTFDTTP